MKMREISSFASFPMTNGGECSKNNQVWIFFIVFSVKAKWLLIISGSVLYKCFFIIMIRCTKSQYKKAEIELYCNVLL